MADWQQVGKKGKAKKGGGRGGGSRPGDVPRPGESYRATVARRLRTDPDYDEEKCIDNVIEASIKEDLHNDDQSAMQKAIAESLCQLQPGGYEDDDSLLQKIMEESRLEALRKNEQMNTIAKLTGMLSEEEQEKRLLLLSRTEAMRAAKAGTYPYSTPQPPSASTGPARAGPRGPEAVTAQPAPPEPEVSEDEELQRALELSILDIDAPPPAEHDQSTLDADEVLARSIQASLEAAEEEERRARDREAKERSDLQAACAASMQAGLDDATPKHAGMGNGGPKGPAAKGPQPNPPVYKSMGGVSAARVGSAPYVPPAPPQQTVPQRFGMNVDSLEDPAVIAAQEASLQDFLRQQQQQQGEDCVDELEAVRDDGIKLEMERKQRLAQQSPSSQRPRGPAWQREEWEDEITVLPVQRPTLSILRGNLDNQIFRFNAEYRVEVTIVEDRLIKLRFNRSKAGARLFNPSKLDETEDVLKVVRALVVETLQKPGVRLQERKEWGIHVFIDWSNIALSARGQGLTRNDNIRVDPARFSALVEADRDVKQRFVAGSRGIAFNEAWPIWEKLGYEKYIEEGGKESAVDMSIREKFIKILLGNFPNKRKIVLCTGDGNFRDSDGVMNQSMISFPELVESAVSKGFWVELWTWRHATAHAFRLMQSRGYGTRMEVKYLDDYRDFVCKAPDEELEFHDAITPGSSAKSSPDLRGGNANMRSPSKGPMICDMMPKLSLLPSGKREDPSPPPPPVQSHKPPVQQPSVMGAGALYSPNDPPLSNSMAQGGARYGLGTIGASNSRMQAPIGPSMVEPMVGATGGGASYMSQYNQPMASYGSRALDPSTASFNPQRPVPHAPVVPTSTVAGAEGSYVAGGSLSMIGGGQYYNPSLSYASMPPASTPGATPYYYHGSAPVPSPYTSFGVPATSGPQMVMMGTPGFQPGGIMGGGMLQGNGYAHPSTAAMQPPSSVQVPQPAPQRPQLYAPVDNHATPLPNRAVPPPQPPKPPVPSISTLRPTSAVGSTTPSSPHVRAAIPSPTVAPVAGLQEGQGSAASLSAKADSKEAPVKTGDLGAAKVEAAGDKKVAATTPNPNRWKWDG